MLVLQFAQREAAPWLNYASKLDQKLPLAANVGRQDQVLQEVLNLAPLRLREVVKDVRLVEAAEGEAPVMRLKHREVLKGREKEVVSKLISNLISSRILTL